MSFFDLLMLLVFCVATPAAFYCLVLYWAFSRQERTESEGDDETHLFL